MRLPSKITGCVIVLMLAACGGFAYHRVQSGETLYSISWNYGLDYHAVAHWNHLKPPYTIYEGQRLRIVPSSGEAAVASIEPSPAPIAPPKRSSHPSHAAPTATIPHWQWPVKGSLLQTFSNSDIGRKGIDIGGQAGEAVRAAAAGKVVYAGSGLLNYGKLIILKHNENYLSAYAYNRQLRVHEGENVIAGQKIADMGGRNNGVPMLHFEIRYDGRPVNPLKYLPSQGH